MKTHRLAAAAFFVSLFVLALMAPVAQAAEASDTGASFRPARVRAFASESTNSVVLREGRSHYLRLSLAEGCPSLSQASRVAFQTGSSLPVADEGSRQVPVVRGAVPTVVSSETRHIYVVALNDNSRTTCRLAGVAVVDQAEFEAAAQLNGQRDNRYAGDGRPAG